MYSEISQREKENKQFLASVAHEIRNPLGGMKINAELLLEETDNSTSATKYATAIAREVDRLALIVDSFLAYARPIETNLIICDLNELLQEVISELQRDFPSAKITINGQARVKVNPGKIRLCLLNLIRNGLEAVPEAPAIKINITNKPGQTEIRFFNAGMPIAPEIQSQIFEAFFSTKPDGIGLGLAITKSLVEQHGGQIYLDHSNTSGTEFVLILPE
jgi:signal transduction histidine kinase